MYQLSFILSFAIMMLVKATRSILIALDVFYLCVFSSNLAWEPPPSTDAHRRSHTANAGNQHLQLPSSARNLQRLDNTHRQIESNLLHKRISTLPSSPQYQGQPNLSYTSPFAFQRSPTSSPTLYPRTSTRIDSQRQRQNDDASPRNRSPYLRTHDYT